MLGDFHLDCNDYGVVGDRPEDVLVPHELLLVHLPHPPQYALEVIRRRRRLLDHSHVRPWREGVGPTPSAAGSPVGGGVGEPVDPPPAGEAVSRPLPAGGGGGGGGGGCLLRVVLSSRGRRAGAKVALDFILFPRRVLWSRGGRRRRRRRRHPQGGQPAQDLQE